MGRIEKALKRAGSLPAELTDADLMRARGQSAGRVEDYPRERVGGDDADNSVGEYPPEHEERNRDARPRIEREPSSRQLRTEQNLRSQTAAAPWIASARQRPEFDESVRGKLVTDSATAASSREQYRRLAAALHQLQLERGFKVLMVSSAIPREGKTLTSVNLALTLTESYKTRVLLVDADLRRPSVHTVFHIPGTPGLGEALRSDRDPLQLVEVSPRLTILPAGPPDRDPTAVLTSDRMRAILTEAATRFDWVIVDTPPVGLLSDARLLGALADGVLLVAGAGSTSYDLIEHAIDEIGRERIVGAVLNRVESDAIAPTEYYNYYYGPPAGVQS
jgi:capsular exopolysaccharide synthesis family protein